MTKRSSPASTDEQTAHIALSTCSTARNSAPIPKGFPSTLEKTNSQPASASTDSVSARSAVCGGR